MLEIKEGQVPQCPIAGDANDCITTVVNIRLGLKY